MVAATENEICKIVQAISSTFDAEFAGERGVVE